MAKNIDNFVQKCLTPETKEIDWISSIKDQTVNNISKIIDSSEIRKKFEKENPEKYKEFLDFIKEYNNIFWWDWSHWIYISDIDRLMLLINYKLENKEDSDVNKIFEILIYFWWSFPRKRKRENFEENSNIDNIKKRFYIGSLIFKSPKITNAAYYNYLDVTSTVWWIITIKNKQNWEIIKIRSYSWYSNQMISEEESIKYSWSSKFFSTNISENLYNIFKDTESLINFYKVNNIVFSSWYMHILWEKWVLETYNLENMKLVNRKFFDSSYSNLKLLRVNSDNILIESGGKDIIYKNIFKNKESEKKEEEFALISEIEEVKEIVQNNENIELKDKFIESWDKIIWLIKSLQEKNIDIKPISYIIIWLINDYKYRFEIMQNWDKNSILNEMIEKLNHDIEETKLKFEKL